MSTIDEFIQRLAANLDLQAQAEFREFERYSLGCDMERCGLLEYPPLVGPAEGHRTDGDMICEVCGHEYIEHPLDWRVIGYGDVPFLNVICDGRRVKL